MSPVQPRNPNIDIYDDPKYVSMIPDFGYFAKIKEKFKQNQNFAVKEDLDNRESGP